MLQTPSEHLVHVLYLLLHGLRDEGEVVVVVVALARAEVEGVVLRQRRVDHRRLPDRGRWRQRKWRW